MQKLRLIIISTVLFLLALPSAVAQVYPVLPKDPAVTSGRLPDGISYLIVPDSAFKGVADVVLLQRVCQSPELTCFRDVQLFRGSDVADSLLTRIFALVRDAIEEDPDTYGTDNQTVIICGDVKAGDMVSKMKELSADIPASRSTATAAPYVWRGPYPPVWTTKMNPDSTAVISMVSRRPRMDEKQMASVIPLVSMRMDKVLELLLCKSLEGSFERLDIPYSRLKFSPNRAWDSFGDDSYTLSVKVRSQDADRAAGAMKAICSELAEGNIRSINYSVVRDAVMSSAFREAVRPLTNKEQTARCVTSAVYGTTLHSALEGYRFFSTRDVPDSVQVRGLNRHASEIFGGTPEAEREKGVRIVTVNRADTLAFPAPSRKKIKVSSTLEDYVTKGTVWTFANGTKVIYKRMATNGMLYYSMVFGCGASDIQDAPMAESSLYGDMFRSAAVGTHSGKDFQRLQEACGVRMDCNVGLYDLALSGSAHMSHLSMLMQHLLLVTKERQPSDKSSAFAMESVRLSIDPPDRVRAMLYDKMHPDYLYTPFRVSEGVTPTLARNAEKLFEQAFSRCDDSVLILVGDREEGEILKVLRRYMSAFRVSGTRHQSPSVHFATIAGEVKVNGAGPRAVAVEMSADMAYTADNYFAVKVLQEALRESLSGYAARISISLNPRPLEHLEMRMSAMGDVSAEDLTGALLSLTSTDSDIYGELPHWKTYVSNREKYLQTAPQYWIDAARVRFTDSKDIVNKGPEKISAVPKEKLASLASALLKGGRVVYYTSPEK